MDLAENLGQVAKTKSEDTASHIDFEKILDKCGNYGAYQYRVLFFFGVINVLSSMHYFSQTIIAFTPEHWCYHSQLANASINVIRNIYSHTKDSSCTPLVSLTFNGTQQPVFAPQNKCHQWIYDKNNNFESITSEVRVFQFTP